MSTLDNHSPAGHDRIEEKGENMEVSVASMEDIETLSELFDQYRLFYKQTSDRSAARTFLEERLKNDDSVIFTAKDKVRVVGFTQLYPSFSSVAMRRIWILNDLYVDEGYRRRGIAELLMNATEHYARNNGASKMILATQISNTVAQKLYEARGYIKDEEFHHYALRLE